ncbi:TetR family transcriptional regulator [Curvibacter sp. HBC28]|uniref:TetR family transcriptional regulator n=1 Tax=Curvibacter microcysteis TaxID=3026419 RepID=A0ABT5MCJ0_9BURK|nr:TetR family transcriptional regulator [Curvibacter sp. HBC28]MDD0813709.1 TetR family transcriptional regulator [Curvibacter sp. HBC28]
MVRRTKEDALATRHSLLDAAEHVFSEKGVSRSSLNDIAVAAGTTRGAIYWHFKDKADLFNAMMERVTLPMEEALEQMGREPGRDPLEDMRQSAVDVLRKMVNDPVVQRVFEVASYKVEYVGDALPIKQRHLEARNGCLAEMTRSLQAAADLHRCALPMPAAMAAQGLHAIVDGLIQNWLLSPGDFDVVSTGQQAIDTFLVGLGFPRPAPQARAL